VRTPGTVLTMALASVTGVSGPGLTSRKVKTCALSWENQSL
jgi:hypothetical protein